MRVDFDHAMMEGVWREKLSNMAEVFLKSPAQLDGID
jgi:hypothetical protein